MFEGGTDKLREIVLFVAGLVALGSLFMAAFEGLNQRVSSAVFLGTLGVVCTFILFMPKIEVFKVWGVEAKMREVDATLTDAKVLTNKLNRIAAINARVSYVLLAWGNRIGGPTAKEKQAVLDEVDKQLAEIDMKPEDRAAIIKPYVKLIGVDLHFIYVQVIERYSHARGDQVRKDYDTDKSEENRVAAEKFGFAVSKWMAERGTPTEDVNGFNFEAAMNRAIPVQWMNERELIQARLFARQLLDMFKACEKKGGYTPEVADFVDKYRDLGGVDEKTRELFGIEYGDVK